ncbi:MAG: glucose-6-phosphate isomerase [Oscillospiraceae bacterium]|nr:glucose-6-phosphate isomerase [Oscillospiraceae bacterium]
MPVSFDMSYAGGTVNPHEMAAVWPQVKTAHEAIHAKTGPGSDFLGWVDLPVNYDKEEFARIKSAAKRIKQDCDALIVVGIGGSYLGSRAAVELLRSQNYNHLPKDTPDIYFAGNNLSPSYLGDILEICKDKDICLNVISKSGTTTEPALAFRVLRDLMEKRYGKEGMKSRIYCTTDKAKGTLKELSDQDGNETFVIPDDIGGRFSVLTPVGLLPIAAAGCDIGALMRGAADARDAYSVPCIEKNSAYQYAAARNLLRSKGKAIEVLVSYEPDFTMMAEWYKQLFGESEGKDHKGLYPSSMIFSTDLHSLGQFVQDGSRTMFETVVNIEKPKKDIFIREYPANFDGLNFLAGQNMSEINKKAMQGTALAHIEGGTPNLVINIPEINEYELGHLIYFFEKACAISGYLLGVNPFDQPGVEAYKNNMFALLGKPGFEARKAELEKAMRNS